MPLSNFRFATEDEDLKDTEPIVRAWHPSDKYLDIPQSVFSNTTAPITATPVSSSMPEQQVELPAAMAKPSFGDFFKNLGKDKQSALGQAALAAGFSLMSTPPSRYPISFGQQIGQAGMAGMQQYGSAMQNAREIEMQNKLFGLKEREVAAQEPYYAARTKALLASPSEKPVTKLQMFDAAQKEVSSMVKQFAPQGSGNALSLLAENPENYFANLQRQPALIDAIEKNIKASKDPYAWAKWQRLNEIRNEFLDVKIRQQEQLFPSADNIGSPELSQEQIKETDTTPTAPGIFSKAISGAGKILKKSALGIAGDLERRRDKHLAEKGIKKENQIFLPSGITTTTDAIKYLQEQGMSSEEAVAWLRSQ